ncbi:asparagine synthase (glutamine-hydrolyzing) [Candidatus Uhrbacteria bacterium]|nr:asparagine synthase (glutamine-hydrolyzing) [Candidatus Uhrbacteria bacterium]
MCGIAGILKKDGSQPDEGLLKRMQQAIHHRGPDAQGLRLFSGCGLVHCRLSIIDLSPAGAQPLTDASGRYWIVFNGEIYNYRELRSELEARGATFQTQTDTEVIIEGYRSWGTKVVERLRGMFAFAIWDTQEQALFMARDHIGKKPLFYTINTGNFFFASELKALQAVCPANVDWDAVRLFLGLQYVPSPKTGFIGIEQLPPSSFLIWSKGNIQIKTYTVQHISVVDSLLSEKASDAELLHRFEDAVRIRLLASDVPVAAFLSGGIDSAAIVAFASKQVSSPLKTFTMGFEDGEFDERDQAQTLAKHFGTDHHAFLAKPEDLLRIADEVIHHYDAPYADSSALPLWLLAEQTAKQVKVVLTGDGGDELFGGYRRYLHLLRGEQIARTPLFGSWAGRNMRKIGTWFHDTDIVRMGRYIEVLRTKPSSAYGELFTGAYFDSQDLSHVFKPDFLKQTAPSDAVEYVSNFASKSKSMPESILAQAMNFDLYSYISDDLNVKMDRATMRFGLEARSPFLDQEMLAFAAQLPLKEKVAHGKTKIALKRALKGIIPDDVIQRQKRGFQVPLAVWFRGPLKQAFAERCLDQQAALAKIVELEEVKRLVEANDAGANHGNRLWMLYSLATWLNGHIS